MARNEEKLKDTLFKLDTTLGQQHQYVVTDFADPAGYKATVEDFFSHNDIDILINNTQGPKAGGVLSKGEATISKHSTCFSRMRYGPQGWRFRICGSRGGDGLSMYRP